MRSSSRACRSVTHANTQHVDEVSKKGEKPRHLCQLRKKRRKMETNIIILILDDEIKSSKQGSRGPTGDRVVECAPSPGLSSQDPPKIKHGVLVGVLLGSSLFHVASSPRWEVFPMSNYTLASLISHQRARDIKDE